MSSVSSSRDGGSVSGDGNDAAPPDRIVIVGGGTCAGTAARTLRENGFDGSVTVVAAERALPYERPALSKEFLVGEATPDSLRTNPVEWYRENNVVIRSGVQVERLDLQDRAVVLPSGERLPFDAVLIATGGRPRTMPVPMPDQRVHHLRTLDDAAALSSDLRRGGRLAVLGAGFVGCEVAAAARGMGLEVVVIEMADAPLIRALGPRLGAAMTTVHVDAGVEMRLGERVQTVTALRDGLRIATDKGVLDCDTLVVAIGMLPNVELAVEAGLRCDDGIIVDIRGETTERGVFAAGDVARRFHPRYGRTLRLEHHDNAVKHGRSVAFAMIGQEQPPEELPWFWSDQYEHNLQLIGVPGGSDTMIVRGSVEERSLSAFFVDGDRLTAVFALDRGKDIVAGRRMLRSGTPVTAQQLGDASVDLGRLARQSARDVLTTGG